MPQQCLWALIKRTFSFYFGWLDPLSLLAGVLSCIPLSSPPVAPSQDGGNYPVCLPFSIFRPFKVAWFKRGKVKRCHSLWMSEDMNRVAAPLPPSPQEFTFSNITNASIKIPFKHHAYFLITIVHCTPLPHTHLSPRLSFFCVFEMWWSKAVDDAFSAQKAEGEGKRQR